jgi:hypothetical protein
LFAAQNLSQCVAIVGDAFTHYDLVHTIAALKNVGWHFSALRFSLLVLS